MAERALGRKEARGLDLAAALASPEHRGGGGPPSHVLRPAALASRLAPHAGPRVSILAGPDRTHTHSLACVCVAGPPCPAAAASDAVRQALDAGAEEGLQLLVVVGEAWCKRAQVRDSVPEKARGTEGRRDGEAWRCGHAPARAGWLPLVSLDPHKA